MGVRKMKSFCESFASGLKDLRGAVQEDVCFSLSGDRLFRKDFYVSHSLDNGQQLSPEF